MLKGGETLDEVNAIAGDLAIKEQRMSFHPSAQSDVLGLMVFTYNILTKTSQIAKGRAEVPILNNDDYWLFFAIRVQDLSLEKYNYTRKACDTVITLFEGRKLGTSLVYYLIAAHPDINESALDNFFMNYRIIRYDTVSLVLVFGFMGLPPLPSSSQILVGTTFVTINGRKTIDYNAKVTARRLDTLAEDVLEKQRHVLTHTHFKLAEFVEAAPPGMFPPEQIESLFRTSCNLYRDPIWIG